MPPLLFGFLIDRVGTGALAVSAGLGLASTAALLCCACHTSGGCQHRASPALSICACSAAGLGDRREIGGSRRDSRWRMWIVGGLEALPEAGAERAVVDSASNLQQQVSAAPGPAHLLRFGHASVDQEVGRPFGDRGPNPQARTVPLGVVDQPGALAGQIAVQRAQRGPQLS